MPIRVPVVQTGLEASIQAAAKKAGKAMKIDMGAGAKSIEGLSQPLGRISGKADQFTKSMEAANARVLAFGASVGVLSAVSRGFQELVKTTIEVEKRLTSINSILGGTSAQLHKFKKEIFDVARNTEQSFDTVSQAALELSRQGLKAEEVTSRLNDSLILARLSGLGASEAVFGLTAAINSFRKEGISSAEVLNKLSAAAVSAAVSEKDLIEGIKRSGSVATQAGVSFNELVGVITAVQERTARGGAVIGNSFKTIFTRIQSLEKLKTMQQLGVQVEDASGQVLGATKLIQNLAHTLEKLPDATRLQIAENLVGKFQIAPFLAILEDYNSATSTAIRVTEVAAGATSEAYERNIAISKTLSHAINETVLSVKELADTLGKIGVTDNLKNILTFFSGLTTRLQKLLDGDGLGSKFAKGIIKGIGGVLSGPGLAIFGAIIAKLTLDLAKFGLGSLKTFFGLNKAARDQVTLQGQIASTLLGNKGIQAQIMAIENSTLSIEQKRAAQTRFFTTALNEQLSVMTRMQAIAARVAPGVMAGTRGRGRGAGGYIPNFNVAMGYGSERADINRGVGGAPKGARPVTMPNFNFGSGQRGTMVANTSEYVVPNFGGSGGSAIFNQNMAASMGLPAGARKIGAAGGYVPNFAQKPPLVKVTHAGMIVPQKGKPTSQALGTFGGVTYQFPVYGIQAGGEKVREEAGLKRDVKAFAIGQATQEAKTMTGGRPRAGKIGKLSNQGAIGSLAGAIFETALSALLKSKEFDFGETGTFDFVGTKAIRDIGDISPLLKHSPIRFLEAKIGSNPKTNISMAKKIQKFFGKSATGRSFTPAAKKELLRGQERVFGLPKGVAGPTRSGFANARGSLGMASGYIPNFATPLEDAINREQAAGLPISQIRINQDSGLRGAGNPMGLAVTNMRDEPTGAIPRGAGGFIPNYQSWNAGVSKAAVTGAGHQWNKAGVSAFKAGAGGPSKPPPIQRDLLGPIFAVTAAMSALQGATSGAESGLAKFTNITAKALSGMATAAFAGTALNQFGKDMGGVGGKFVSKLGLYGAALGAGVAIFKGINDAITEATGKNKDATLAMAALADATKNLTFKFETLTEVRKAEIQEEAKRIVTEGTVTIQKLDIPDAKGAARGFDDEELAKAKMMDVDVVRTFAPGKDKESGKTVKESFIDAASHLIALGMTSKEVDDKLDEFGNHLTAGNLDTLSDFIKTLDKGLRQDAEDFRSTLNKLTDEQFKALQKGLKGDVSGATIVPLSLQAGEALTAARVQAGLPEAGKLLPSERKGELVTEDSKRREELRKGAIAEGARLEIDAQKKILTAVLEVSRIRLTNTNEIKNQIAAAKILGNLTGEELRALERKEFVDDQANKRLTNRINLVKEQVKATGGLSINENERNLLAEKFAGLKREDIENEEQLKAIVGETIVLDKRRSIAADKLVKSLFNILTAEEKAADAQDALNLLFKDGDISTRNIADNLTRATAQLVLAAGTRAFGVTQGNVRGNMAANQNINRLQNQLVGADPQDAEIIERQLNNLRSGIAGRGGQDIAATGLAEAVKLALPIAQLAEGFEPDSGGVPRSTVQQGDITDAASAQAILRQMEALAKSPDATRKQRQLLDDGVLEDLRQKVQEQTDATADAANNAQNLADALTPLDRAIRESALSVRQARAMGVGVEEAERLDLATNKALSQGLTPQNARTLNTLQRSVGQRLIESPDFNEIYQTDALNESLKNASLNFKNTMSDAMVDAIIQGGSLGDVLRSAATDFFTMISKAYMQDSVNKIVGGGLGFLGSLFGTRAGGGLITGGSGNRDDVPTLLTGGEFVVRKGAVEKYGAGFFEGLNTGSVGQMQRGGYFTPGTYGQGAIRGKRPLLDFSTQSHTAGLQDKFSEGAGFGSASLEPQSAALTMFGRRNSPLFQREQQSKQQAFGLYLQQINAEEAAKEAKDQRKKSLIGSMIAAVGAVGLNAILGGLGKGFTKTQQGMIDSPLTGSGFGRHFGAGGAQVVGPPLAGGSRTGGSGFFGGIGRELSSLFTGGGQSTVAQNNGTGFRGGGGDFRFRAGPSRFRETATVGAPGVLPVRNVLETRAGLTPDMIRLLRELAEADGNAAGGYISPTAGVDTVPSMLSGGEFVMNAAATQRMGRGNLAALNSGGGGEGGDGAVVARLDELIAVTDGSGETVINITVNSDGTESQDSQGGGEDQQNLATKIKDVVRATIEEEKRLGGSLRRV